MTEYIDLRRITELVDQALGVEGVAREKFLDATCADDPALRKEVESLLAEEDALSDGFLQEPAISEIGGDLAKDLEYETSAALPTPEVIGPYRIVGTLGEGGMGKVYLAEQSEPMHRRVALKAIDSVHHRGLRKRFAAECQALARLSHPNIASLYEAGTAEDGHLFVVMELVEGNEITTWCDQRRLGLKARIELFLGVCAGVRHAHEKGILHRDLKPSNVLVTEVDGKSTAKVIDFGIARAFEGPALSTDPTREVFIGSPAYTSPEAAAMGSSRDMDTRSDVYSLGLLLYQLLMGALPFPTEGQTVPTLLRRIASEDPLAPSLRFAELEEDAQQEIVEHRELSRKALVKELRSDLDAIALKATARARDERYGSPADLAADLRRHLQNEPVAAHPPTSSYRLSRLLRRHWRAVASIGLLILALSAGVVARSLEARRANQEAQRAMEALAEAEEVSKFLVDLFATADPERPSAEKVTARELLDTGAEKLLSGLGGQSLARARFLETAGEIYTKLAVYEQAEKLVAKALAIREEELASNHPDVARSVTELGIIYRRQGRLEEAEPLMLRAVELREQADHPDPRYIALAHNHVGNLRWAQKRYVEAEQAHRRGLAIRQRVLASDDPNLAESLNNLGVALQEQKRFEEAVPMILRALEIFKASLGADHPRVGVCFNNLGLMAALQENWVEAEDYYLQALEIYHHAYGPNHPSTRRVGNNLVNNYLKVGDFDDAETMARGMLDSALESEDPESRIIQRAQERLEKVLEQRRENGAS